MKYILLILCIALVGCEKSELDKSLTANHFLQAGMIDKAEKYYQELILSDENELATTKWLWKDQLLELYLKSNQIEKADKYMAFVIFSDDQGIDYKMMSASSEKVAKALYNDKKYKRAMFHYKNAADYISNDKSRNAKECNVESISLIVMAYDSAERTDMNSEALLLKEQAIQIINEDICKENPVAFQYQQLLN